MKDTYYFYEKPKGKVHGLLLKDMDYYLFEGNSLIFSYQK